MKKEIISEAIETKSTSKKTYKPIEKNIYFDGYSFRTRVQINGKMNSRNSSTLGSAKKFRTNIIKKSKTTN